MLQDFKQAMRALIAAPGFTVVVIVVLALGIGANTAIFSIVNGVLLEPLPFAGATRLVTVLSSNGRDEEDGSASYPDFADWKAQSSTIERMAGYATGTLTLTGSGEAATLQAAFVTPDLLPLLGVAPSLGRPFTGEDDRAGAAGAAILSDAIWRDRFARDPQIVGRAVTLDAQRFTIVGVMPASFQFPIQAERVAVWVPIGAIPLTAQFKAARGAHFMTAIGHLADLVPIDRARTELTAIAGRLAAAYPQSNSDQTAHVRLLQDVMVRDVRLGLIVLLCAVGAVLLIACANVANLLLARATTRQKEMAIRSALGANRGRLIRQLLTESVLLSAAAGALGIVFALWGVDALIAASPLEIPRLHDVRIDRTVLAFTSVVSMLTGVLFGLAPAVFLARADGGDALKDAGRGSTAGRSARTRQVLVVAEIALSLVLIASAGLLVQTLVRLGRVDPGFAVERAVAMEVSLPGSRYPDAKAQIGFYRRLLENLATIPGAASTAAATTLPMSGSDLGIGFTVDGHPPADPKTRTAASFFAVSPGYFTTMGIRLVRGRTFTDRDDQSSPNAIIINETMARRFWPNEDPIGRRMTIGFNKSGPRDVVGIVGDVKQTGLAQPTPPQMYTPFPQTPLPFMTAVVRTRSDAAAAGGALRAAVARLDPDQPAGEIKTLEQYLARAIAEPRFNAMLVTVFAALALLLAGFGLYGVMAYSVAQRGREIGIRMALGAQPADIRTLVVSQALWIGVIGIGVGLAGALAATRVLNSLLFGVGASDPATFAAVSALLLSVLMAAAYLPARRATRVDPLVALRAD